MFIRSHARLTGTKFMCLEGGCGACVVNISGIRTPTGESRTIAVNSVRYLTANFCNSKFDEKLFEFELSFPVSLACVRVQRADRDDG